MDSTTASILAEIPIGRSDVLRVSRRQDRGRDVVDIRRWFRAKSGELRPDRDGITLPGNVVDSLADALGSLRSGKTGSEATGTASKPQRSPASSAGTRIDQ